MFRELDKDRQSKRKHSSLTPEINQAFFFPSLRNDSIYA